MTPKFFEANDPKINGKDTEQFFRDLFQIVAIEDLNADSYFVMQGRKSEYSDISIIVRHKNLAREIFSNYTEALELIQRVKDSAYGN